jgi:hypothetical protein
MRQVWAHALREGTSLTTYEALKVEMEASIARGEFLGLVRGSQIAAEGAERATPAGHEGSKQLDYSEREIELETPGQPLSPRSIDQNSSGQSLATDTFDNREDDSLASGAEELGEDLELENSIELGFAL